MHAMPYLFIFFLGGGEAIAIQLTHPTHNSTHVMTPTWGGAQKPNSASFYADKVPWLVPGSFKKVYNK